MTRNEIERLREILIDYFGTGQGAFSFFSGALGEISGANEEQLKRIARMLENNGEIDLSGFDLDDDIER